MTGDGWDRATFAGTERAQAKVIASLTPDARMALLEQLIDVAQASGALQLARERKQRALDDRWSGSAAGTAGQDHRRPGGGSGAGAPARA